MPTGKSVRMEETGKGKMSLEMVLADEDWDYVSLQQASTFSGMYETYEASLPELIEYVKARLPKKTKLMLHQTWAYASTSNHGGFQKLQPRSADDVSRNCRCSEKSR